MAAHVDGTSAISTFFISLLPWKTYGLFWWSFSGNNKKCTEKVEKKILFRAKSKAARCAILFTGSVFNRQLSNRHDGALPEESVLTCAVSEENFEKIQTILAFLSFCHHKEIEIFKLIFLILPYVFSTPWDQKTISQLRRLLQVFSVFLGDRYPWDRQSGFPSSFFENFA